MVNWRDVSMVVQDAKDVSGPAGALRAAGFTVDSFESKRAARVIVCGALTRMEDAMELRGMSIVARKRLQAVRRRLECELWP